MSVGAADLGSMRSFGVRSLDVECRSCGHHTTVNVDHIPDDVVKVSLGSRMRCTKCRHKGAHVRPDWSQLVGVPKRA
jgi:hypothetical protein